MDVSKNLVDVHGIYSLFNQNGIARLRVADIDTIPRVDALEVVRCRECKHLEKDDGLKYGRMCLMLGSSLLCHDEDFCKYGERRDADGSWGMADFQGFKKKDC